MPIREHVCPHGHVKSNLYKSDFPQVITCDECGEIATYRIGRIATPGMREGSHVETKPRGEVIYTGSDGSALIQRGKAPVILREWICESNHRHFDVYETEPEPPLCPTCQLQCRRDIVGADLGWIEKDHPNGWFDTGLGCWIRDRAHWEQVKAEKGVVDVSDWGPAMDRQNRERAEKAKREDEHVAEMFHNTLRGPDAEATRREWERLGLDAEAMAKGLGVE